MYPCFCGATWNQAHSVGCPQYVRPEGMRGSDVAILVLISLSLAVLFFVIVALVVAFS